MFYKLIKKLFMVFIFTNFCCVFAAQKHVEMPLQNSNKSLRILKAVLLQKLMQNLTDLDAKSGEMKRELAFLTVDKHNPRVDQIKRTLKNFAEQSDKIQEKIDKLKHLFDVKKRSVLINKCKLKAFIVMGLFSITSSAAIYYFYKNISAIQDEAEKRKIIILVSVIATCFVLFQFLIYFFSEHIALAVTDAEKLDPDKYGYVYKMSKILARHAGISEPNLFMLNSKELNAFAAGRGPSAASVVLTQGILDALSEDELRCVLGHEISHIRNYDVLWNTMLLVCSIPLYFIADKIKFTCSRKNTEICGENVTLNDVSNHILFRCVGTCMKLLVQLFKLFVSRSDEYRADEEGAMLGEDPDAMANALRKLRQNNRIQYSESYPEHGFNNLFEGAFIVPSAYNAKQKHDSNKKHSKLYSIVAWIDELFADHPQTEKRISAMKDLDKFYRDEIRSLAMS